MIVNDISKGIIVIPVKWSEFSKVNLNQDVIILSPDVDEEINGKVISIDNNVKTINAVQYVFVTVLSENGIGEFKHGLHVDCKIACGNAKLTKMILDFLKPIIR